MTLRRVLGIVAFLISSVAPCSSVAMPVSAIETHEAQLTGLVRDGLGSVLDRTLVLLTPLRAPQAVRSAVTDREGRFAFPAVPFDTYRITAVKDGYESTVGKVSTWIQSRFDLVLIPAGEPRVPPPSTWILTAPRRDILRDLDAVAGLEEPASGSQTGIEPLPIYAADRDRASGLAPSAQFLHALDGEVMQSFTETQHGSSSDAEVTGGSGTSTSLLLGGAIGSRAYCDILGQRDRDTTSLRNSDFQARQARAERVRVSLRYDTGKDSRLEMRAYYDSDSLAFEPIAASSAFDIDRKRRAWGYDAGWVGDVGEESSLEVDLRYLGSFLYGGGEGRSDRALSRSEVLADKVESGTNIWRTAAHLSKKVGADHRVHVGVNARMHSFEGPERSAPSAAQDPALFAALGRDGWTVSVNAAESWNVVGPLALDFGFDVSRSVYSTSRLRHAVIPQAGVTFTPTRETTVRGVISYVALDRDVSTVDVPDDRTARDAGHAIGYKLRFERGFGERWLLVLDAESRPFFHDSIGARWDPPQAVESGRNLYLTDEGASLKEVDLSLEVRPVASTVLSLRAGSGRVEGRVATSIPDYDLSQSLEDGTVQYRVAHLSGSFEQTGTDVRIDLTRLNQGDTLRGGPYGDRRLAVKILQRLTFLHPGDTSWAFLLTYSSYVPLLPSDAESPRRAPSVRAALNRVSGGVSMKF